MEKHEKGIGRLNETVRKVIVRTMFFLVLFSVFFLFLSRRPVYEIYGLFAGGVLGLFAFLDLKNALVRSSIMSPNKAKNYAAFRYFLRFVVVGIVFALMFKSPYTGALGGVIGFSAIKVAVYTTHIFDRKGFFSGLFRREE